MTRDARYVLIVDGDENESKCSKLVHQTWKSRACDVPAYCSRSQPTPVQMYQTLFDLYGEPSACRPSLPDQNVVGFAEWNFAPSRDAQRVNQIVVHDAFLYNDEPEKHVELFTARVPMEVYDDDAKRVLNTMSDNVHVDALQHQLYVRADDLQRANAMIAAAIAMNTPNRAFVDNPANLFHYFAQRPPLTCHLPEDARQQAICRPSPNNGRPNGSSQTPPDNPPGGQTPPPVHHPSLPPSLPPPTSARATHRPYDYLDGQSNANLEPTEPATRDDGMRRYV